MKKKKKCGVLRKAVALLAVVVLLMSAMSMFAFADSQAVTDATSGVFWILFCYPYEDDPNMYYTDLCCQGTGFLINENTVVTAYHVLHDEEVINAMKAYNSNWQSKVQIRVYYQAGAFVTATEISGMANRYGDYTAIKLSTPLKGHDPIPLVDNTLENVNKAETVYALGYPGFDFSDLKTTSLTAKDVTVTSSIVSKIDDFEGVQTISHNAKIDYGMSGGPLVNGDGEAIGIHRGKADNNGEKYYFSTCVDPLIASLRTLDIQYTPAGSAGSYEPEDETTSVSDETTTVPVTEAAADPSSLAAKIVEAEKLSEKDYTAESYKSLEDAINAAKRVREDSASTQEQINQSEDDLQKAIDGLEKKMPIIPIAIAAVALVLIIAVVIIVLVVKKGKNSGDDFDEMPVLQSPEQQPRIDTGFTPAPNTPAQNFVPVSNANDMGTEVLDSGSAGTTVLNNGSIETSILSKAYANLIRKSNGEIVKVSSPTFVIGKERSKVNFCISDNGTISRKHAQIVKTPDGASIVDLGSKNGTFVNGVKTDANVTTPLKDGDKIVLSEEEFTFKFM